jgi:hypothetical protein
VSCVGDESVDTDSEDEVDPKTGPSNIEGASSKEIEREKESKAAEEISALVNYIQAVRFHGFEQAERKYKTVIHIPNSNYTEIQHTSMKGRVLEKKETRCFVNPPNSEPETFVKPEPLQLHNFKRARL